MARNNQSNISRTINLREELQAQKREEIGDFYSKINLEQAHPKWQDEIEESLDYSMIQRLKHISTDLGVLGVLIFIRLFNLHVMASTASEYERKYAKEQLSFSNKYATDVPSKTDHFLVFVAE